MRSATVSRTPERLARAAELWASRRKIASYLKTRALGLSAGMKVVGLLTTFSAQELRHQPLIADFRDVALTVI